MGVVGAGKTTVGKLLAEQMGWEFGDADDFHHASNVEKIRNGVPLTDKDREPWLDLLRAKIVEWIEQRRSAVLACSALKKIYRDKLDAGPEVRFVYLKGSRGLIASRLKERRGHFANESILASQLVDLEEPASAFAVEVSQTPQQIVSDIRKGLALE
jgi:gluconokinase